MVSVNPLLIHYSLGLIAFDQKLSCHTSSYSQSEQQVPPEQAL